MKKFSKLKLFGAAAASGKNLFGSSEAQNTAVKRSTSQLRLRGKDKEQKLEQPVQNEVKKLPENFAEQVLDCELEIEKEEVNIEVVKRLIDLYQLAMEYYESINSDRHLIFLSKTQALLSKSNVVHAMNNSVDSKKTFTKQYHDEKERRLEEFVRKTKENKIHFDDYAGSILKSHEAGQNSVYLLIMNSLSMQRGLMKQKLERRKKAHLRKLYPEQFSPEKISSERTSDSKRRKTVSKDMEDEIARHNRKSSISSSVQISKQLILSALSGGSTPDKSRNSPGTKSKRFSVRESPNRETAKEGEASQDNLEFFPSNEEQTGTQDILQPKLVINEEKEELEAAHQDEISSESKDIYSGLAVKKLGGDPTVHTEPSIEETKTPLSSEELTVLRIESDKGSYGRVIIDKSPEGDSQKHSSLTEIPEDEALLTHSQRKSLANRPGSKRVSIIRENSYSEQSKKELLDKLEADHAIQLQELIKKQEELRVSEIEAIQKKYQEARDNIEIEMQDTSVLLKKKLIEKSKKEEIEAIGKFEEEWKQKAEEEQHSLVKKQKQEKLFKISQLSF